MVYYTKWFYDVNRRVAIFSTGSPDGKAWKLKSARSMLALVECARFAGGAVALVYRRR
jgi:hypothetical protein